ncbi:hypothetical protein BX285_3434 [Streptomyces sp. 1114.5]|uniref:hypothetical protein n=1 Tax=Streptomyces sp. 1114.5 TaxID=1938830 RepID=UPI000EB01517|nr:hypothetical protein [Streptomyces sp. 1114.5]RKT18992.1 hypothetical protein BX285_3434 [Streptomyces sp. 1114.5]
MSPIKLSSTAAVTAASLALACFASDLVPAREPATADVVWWTTLAAALMTGITRRNDDDRNDRNDRNDRSDHDD